MKAKFQSRERERERERDASASITRHQAFALAPVKVSKHFILELFQFQKQLITFWFQSLTPNAVKGQPGSDLHRPTMHPIIRRHEVHGVVAQVAFESKA